MAVLPAALAFAGHDRHILTTQISGTVEVGGGSGNTRKISVSAINTGGRMGWTLAPSPLDLGPVLVGKTATDAMPKGKYRTASNKLTLGDWLTYSYCVNGDEMTLSPAPDLSTSFFSTPYQGTVVLQRSGG